MYLITGCNGQLGTELKLRLPNAIAVDRDALDITDAAAVEKFVRENNVDLIINCAAYTAVDRAESEEDTAAKINVDGPRNLAAVCNKIIHISTDYVFDGMGHKPYTPDDKTNPVSAYGRTKLAGERAVLSNASAGIVIRTAWLYSPYGNNFVKTMRRLGAEKTEINVVSDQIGSPTYAGDLADAIVKIIPQLSEKTAGIYHFSNEGACSWYDFATEIMDASKLNCVVNPILSSQYPTPAVRPFYSVLDKNKIKNTFGITIPHWKRSLYKCIKQF